jgi:putative flavoprotein involved in K+ transport
MDFVIEWPNGERQRCYSPSSVVEEHLVVGEQYALGEFLTRVRRALELASERVRARYGFACSSALDQLARLDETAATLPPSAPVKIVAFAKKPPRHARALPTHRPVVVIGGGQAGLSVSYCLKAQGIEHVILERARVGNSWRTERWDTFCLVTPNWQCQLPGHPYRGDDPHGFMGRDEIVAYLERYVASFAPPLCEGVTVHAVVPAAHGFVVETSLGQMRADQVVVATGGYHRPLVPDMATQLPSDIVQIHSSAYRNSAALPDGAVLVVGSGQSGCQIAEDLHLAGRQVHLSVGTAPRCARRYRGRDVVEWLDRMGHYQLPVDQHPSGAAVRDKTNHYVTGRDGGRDIDLRQLARAGMRLYGPLRGVRGNVVDFAPELKRNLDHADDVYRTINRSIDAYIAQHHIAAPVEPEYVPPWQPDAEPTALDCVAAGIRAIVWCIGFATDFAWVKAPVFDERGHPRHERGVSSVAGLYFIGLPWLYTWGSGRFSGVGRDAQHIVERIAALTAASSRAADTLS